MKKDGTNAPTAVHDPSGITYHPNKKSYVIADCLENQFTSHDLCDENHERQVETRVQALLTSVDDTLLAKVRPCDKHKLLNSLKLRQTYGLDGNPNECLRHLPRRPLLYLTHLFNHCLWLSHFPKPWKKAEVITLPKPDKDPKFLQNLPPISLLPTSKLLEKVILKIVQRHMVERGLLNASQFGFHGHHSTTLQCMRLMNHITLNINNNTSMAVVFLIIEKAFETTWHLGLLYKFNW
jgi:hypothetical protein